MTRRVEQLSYAGRDLAPLLRTLDDDGWAGLVDVDPDDQQRIRQLVKDVERAEGWHLRTSYHEPSRTLTFVRSAPL